MNMNQTCQLVSALCERTGFMMERMTAALVQSTNPVQSNRQDTGKHSTDEVPQGIARP